MKYRQQPQTIQKLILLWGFVESGLGGMMHLLQIPFTGFVIGAFSIIINVLLVRYSRFSLRIHLFALGLVLLIKFTLSPHSPLGAYLAVAFQGLLAALWFKSLGIHRFSVLGYALLVMWESALQKPLMATLIFGQALWEGVYEVADRFLGLGDHTEVVIWGLLGAYLGIYTLWGMLIGWWSFSFVHRIDDFSHTFRQSLREEGWETKLPEYTAGKVPRQNHYGWWAIAAALLLLTLSWLSWQNGWLYALRTLLLLLLVSLVLPWLLRQLLRRYAQKREQQLRQIIDELPAIRARFLQAYQMSKKETGLGRIKRFLLAGIYLNLFYESKTTVAAERPHTDG